MRVETALQFKISVPHGGATIMTQSPDGEIDEINLPQGKYSGSIFEGQSPQATVTFGEGVKVIRPNSARVTLKQASPEIHNASGANPDFQPASGTEAEIKALKKMVGGLVAKDKRNTEELKIKEAATIKARHKAEAKAATEAAAAAQAAKEAEQVVDEPAEQT